ncbi:uncharacterized protein LOC144059084 isoform X2 [Vanacampus margaritifer]
MDVDSCFHRVPEQLTFLDDRPVFPRDRACAEAWALGGLELERKEREQWDNQDRKKIQESLDALSMIKKKAQRRLRLKEEAQRGDSEASISSEVSCEDVAAEKIKSFVQDTLNAQDDFLKSQTIRCSENQEDDKGMEAKVKDKMSEQVEQNQELDGQKYLLGDEARREPLTFVNHDDQGFQLLSVRVDDSEEAHSPGPLGAGLGNAELLQIDDIPGLEDVEPPAKNIQRFVQDTVENNEELLLGQTMLQAGKNQEKGEDSKSEQLDEGLETDIKHEMSEKDKVHAQRGHEQYQVLVNEEVREPIAISYPEQQVSSMKVDSPEEAQGPTVLEDATVLHIDDILCDLKSDSQKIHRLVHNTMEAHEDYIQSQTPPQANENQEKAEDSKSNQLDEGFETDIIHNVSKADNEDAQRGNGKQDQGLVEEGREPITILNAEQQLSSMEVDFPEETKSPSVLEDAIYVDDILDDLEPVGEKIHALVHNTLEAHEEYCQIQTMPPSEENQEINEKSESEKLDVELEAKEMSEKEEHDEHDWQMSGVDEQVLDDEAGRGPTTIINPELQNIQLPLVVNSPEELQGPTSLCTGLQHAELHTDDSSYIEDVKSTANNIHTLEQDTLEANEDNKRQGYDENQKEGMEASEKDEQAQQGDGEIVRVLAVEARREFITIVNLKLQEAQLPKVKADSFQGLRYAVLLHIDLPLFEDVAPSTSSIQSFVQETLEDHEEFLQSQTTQPSDENQDEDSKSEQFNKELEVRTEEEEEAASEEHEEQAQQADGAKDHVLCDEVLIEPTTFVNNKHQETLLPSVVIDSLDGPQESCLEGTGLPDAVLLHIDNYPDFEDVEAIAKNIQSPVQDTLEAQDEFLQSEITLKSNENVEKGVAMSKQLDEGLQITTEVFMSEEQKEQAQEADEEKNDVLDDEATVGPTTIVKLEHQENQIPFIKVEPSEEPRSIQVEDTVSLPIDDRLKLEDVEPLSENIHKHEFLQSQTTQKKLSEGLEAEIEDKISAEDVKQAQQVDREGDLVLAEGVGKQIEQPQQQDNISMLWVESSEGWLDPEPLCIDNILLEDVQPPGETIQSFLKDILVKAQDELHQSQTTLQDAGNQENNDDSEVEQLEQLGEVAEDRRDEKLGAQREQAQQTDGKVHQVVSDEVGSQPTTINSAQWENQHVSLMADFLDESQGPNSMGAELEDAVPLCIDDIILEDVEPPAENIHSLLQCTLEDCAEFLPSQTKLCANKKTEEESRSEHLNEGLEFEIKYTISGEEEEKAQQLDRGEFRDKKLPLGMLESEEPHSAGVQKAGLDDAELLLLDDSADLEVVERSSPQQVFQIKTEVPSEDGSVWSDILPCGPDNESLFLMSGCSKSLEPPQD